MSVLAGTVCFIAVRPLALDRICHVSSSWSTNHASDHALCTVFNSGYDVQDLAAHCIFEEVAYLLVYGSLPTQEQLKGYCAKLARLRELPAALRQVLEQIPTDAHPMDVMRTGCSVLGSLRPEGAHGKASAGRLSQFDVFDTLLAAFGNIMLYWYHFQKSGVRLDTKGRASDTIARHFMRLMHPGVQPREEQVKTVDLSLILYAEHGFAGACALPAFQVSRHIS